MAWIQPIHVDQVYPGQPAVLRFSAFPARITPEFEGEVVRVSADAAHDTQSGGAWYEAEVAIRMPEESRESSSGNGDRKPRNGIDDLALAPGMPVEVHIRTGGRSLVSYLSKAVTDFFGGSLREE